MASTGQGDASHEARVDSLDVLSSAQVGAWRWYRASGAVVWNEQLERLFGLPPGTFGGTFDHWIALLHPDDVADVVAQLEAAATSGEPLRFDHRCTWPDGSVHWIEGRGSIVFDESGEVVGGAGVALGIDARRAFLRLATALSLGATRREIAEALAENGMSALDASTSSVVLVEEIEADPSSDDVAAARARDAARALEQRDPVAIDRRGEVRPCAPGQRIEAESV
jgi:PAS domain S-box-containing protein